MSTALDVLDDDVRARLPTRGHPRWLEPMRAVLTDDRFSDPRLGRVPTDAELAEHVDVDRVPLRRGRLGH